MNSDVVSIVRLRTLFSCHLPSAFALLPPSLPLPLPPSSTPPPLEVFYWIYCDADDIHICANLDRMKTK